MGRALAIIILSLGVAGFGLCGLLTGAFGIGLKHGEVLLVFSLLLFGLTGLCIWGLRVVVRRGRTSAAAQAEAPADRLPPPGP